MMKRRRGFVLIVALLVMVLLVSGMGIVAQASRILSMNCRQMEYDAWHANLQASGRAWVTLQKTPPNQTTTLPLDELNIPGAQLKASPCEDGSGKSVISSTCGRGDVHGEMNRVCD